MKKYLPILFAIALTLSFLKISGQNGLNIVVQQGHSTSIGGCATTIDGKLIVTGGHDGVLKLWNENGVLIRNYILPFFTEFWGFANNITEVEISPEGDQVFAKFDEKWYGWKIDGTFLGKRDNPYPVEIARKVRGYSVDASLLPWGEKIRNTAGIWELPDQRYIVDYYVRKTLAVCNKSGEPIVFLGNKITNIVNVMFSNDPKQVNYIYAKLPDKQENYTSSFNRYYNLRNLNLNTLDFTSIIKKEISNDNITFSVSSKKNITDTDPFYAVVVDGNYHSVPDKIIIINKHGKEIKREEGKDLSYQIWISPDGSYYLEDDGRNVVVKDLDGKTLRKFEAGVTSNNPFFTFSKDGSRFLSYRGNGLFVFDKTGKRLAKFDVGVWVDKLPNNQVVNYDLYYATILPDGNGMFLVVYNNDRYYFKTVDLEGKSISQCVVPSEMVENKKFNRNVSNTGPFVKGKFSPDGSFIAGINNGNDLVLLSPKGEIIRWLKGHISAIESFDISADGKQLVSTGDDNSIKIWNTQTGDYVNLLQNNTEWIIYTPDGYYDCSSNGGKLISVVNGMESFAIDQFAVKYNRPDIILKRIGIGTNELIAHYENLYKKRLRKLGITEEQLSQDMHVPLTSINSSRVDGKNASLSIKFSDDRYALNRYNVYVNDIPLFGMYGKPLSGQNADVSETVELSSGDNKIEVSCVNEKGAESYRVVLNTQYKEATTGDLYLLAFGVSKYSDTNLNLQFADKDAKDIATVVENLKSRPFNNVYTKVITNEQVTTEAIKTSKEFVKNAKVDDTFILFIAGHGMHDTDADATYYYLTSNTDLQNLKGTAANFETIEDLLQGIPPRNKLFLMDACESGEIDDETYENLSGFENLKGLGIASRGFKSTSPVIASGAKQSQTTKRSYLYQKDRFIYNDLVRRSGAIVFSSSRGGELSYERGDVQNGLFTEYLLKAFTTPDADNDKDNQISTDELRNYVSTQVAKASGDLQHPTVDRDNIYQRFGFGYSLHAANALEGNAAESDLNLFFDMVDVKGGTYKMGSESDKTKVTVADFCIAKFEVTQKQWSAVMGENPSRFSGCDECPVENISWNDAQLFIKKLNEKTGKNYRLPTQAEWEYAARGGNKSQGYKYYSGSINQLEVGWFKDNSEGKTHPVGTKQPNELEIYDMSGNVQELCQDWQNPDNLNWGKAMRGGSIDDYFRNIYDNEGSVANKRNAERIIGLRLAADAK